MESASYQANHGDGEGGRAVFELLANHGSARGAFALAETYHPVRLAQHPEWRLQPDLRLARQWYQKAAALGSAPAHDRRGRATRAPLPDRRHSSGPALAEELAEKEGRARLRDATVNLRRMVTRRRRKEATSCSTAPPFSSAAPK